MIGDKRPVSSMTLEEGARIGLELGTYINGYFERHDIDIPHPMRAEIVLGMAYAYARAFGVPDSVMTELLARVDAMGITNLEPFRPVQIPDEEEN